MFYKGYFIIDDWFGPFEGWASDENWNGWACPYFDFSTAMNLVDAWAKTTFNGEVFEARYDQKRDKFCFYESAGGEWDCFGPQTIEAEGKSVKVYPIGAYCWTWEDETSA